ncbi:MAG TPA: secretin N-terminal domain-containing protein [Lacunisphaera sp.]|jgi:general secretion pathway protein D
MNHSVFPARLLAVLVLSACTVFAQSGPTPSSIPSLRPSGSSGLIPILPTPQPSGSSTPQATSGDDLVGPLTMPGDSIDAVLELIARWTGKTLLRPQNLPQATITFNLRERISKKEAIQGLETELSLNGIAITPLGERFLKVTALNAAKSEAPELIEGSTLGLAPSGRTASKLFTLKFLRVTEFMPQIAALLNPAAGSPPVVFDKGNSALVTDSISNLQRVETLINQMDQPSLAGLTPKFYQIKYGAKASDIVTKINAILTGPLRTQLGTSTTFSADDRTNQIAVIADPRQYDFFDELISKLDVKSDPNTRNEVIRLKAATAADVAKLLGNLITGQNNAAKSAGQENVNRPQYPTAAAPGQPTPAPNTNASPILSALASQGITPSSNQFSSLLTIEPDDRTNSLVVSGTVDDLRLIHELVDKIDILLAQVRIEVVIAEVTLSDGATSGIDALGLKVSNGRLTGLVGSGPGVAVTGLPAAGTTTTTGSTTTYATLLDGLNAVINLSTTPRKGNTTILSRPTISTTHNKEATIFVGETIPTITGSTSSNAAVGATNPYTTSSITQQEVGIKITVKPLIGTDGSVQLDLKQEISDVGDPVTIDGNVQNIILKRTTSSFITAKSGEILVLAGLQKKTNVKSTSRLGPIPFLGDLFGTRTRKEQRDELIFFLRPTVLTNTPADNAPAFKEVDQLPKEQREGIKATLGLPSGS